MSALSLRFDAVTTARNALAYVCSARRTIQAEVLWWPTKKLPIGECLMARADPQMMARSLVRKTTSDVFSPPEEVAGDGKHWGPGSGRKSEERARKRRADINGGLLPVLREVLGMRRAMPNARRRFIKCATIEALCGGCAECALSSYAGAHEVELVEERWARFYLKHPLLAKFVLVLPRAAVARYLVSRF